MPSPRKSSNQLVGRREQGEFSKEEKKFLNAFLPVYLGIFYSPSGDRPKKGDKKDWVLENVYPKFLTEFKSDGPDGPNLNSLSTKMVRYFANRHPANSVTPKALSTNLVKKPRATNGLEVFAKENKEEIMEKMAEKRQEGTAPHDNITLYKQVRDELWEDLDSHGQAEFEEKALGHNEGIRKGPTDEDIDQNRQNVVLNTIDALRSLIGTHWKGHGDIVFFVQGAYRSSPDRLHNFSASIGSSQDLEGFHLSVANFKDDFQKPFKKWARKVLPEIIVEPEENTTALIESEVPGALSISLLDDGFPSLPDVEMDSVSPKDAKRLVSDY